MYRLSQIRQKVTQALKDAAIIGVGDNVFPSRASKVWNGEGDVILVYTQDSDFDDQDTSPVIYKVETDLVIQVIVQDDPDGEADLEDRMDQLTELAVRALQPVHGIEGPLDGVLEWMHLTAIRPTLSGSGEVLKFSQSVIFRSEWRIALPDEDAPDEFLTMGTTLGPPEDAQAESLEVIFNTNMRTSP